MTSPSPGARLRELRQEAGVSCRCLGREIGLSDAYVSQMERGLAPLSLHLPRGEEMTLADFILAEDDSERRLLALGVRQALSSLPARQRRLMLLLLTGHSWAEVGAALGISSSRLGQIRAEALAKMLPFLEGWG